jgi:hypothetical protein
MPATIAVILEMTIGNIESTNNLVQFSAEEQTLIINESWERIKEVTLPINGATAPPTLAKTEDDDTPTARTTVG